MVAITAPMVPNTGIRIKFSATFIVKLSAEIRVYLDCLFWSISVYE